LGYFNAKILGIPPLTNQFCSHYHENSDWMVETHVYVMICLKENISKFILTSSLCYEVVDRPIYDQRLISCDNTTSPCWM